MADDPAPPKRNRIQRRASQLLQELDRKVERRNSQEAPTRPTPRTHKARVKRRHSQALPPTASLDGPPVVWAGGSTRPPPLPMHLKLLVAPIAGMLAGTLEITSLWPMEWVRTACRQRGPYCVAVVPTCVAWPGSACAQYTTHPYAKPCALWDQWWCTSISRDRWRASPGL